MHETPRAPGAPPRTEPQPRVIDPAGRIPPGRTYSRFADGGLRRVLSPHYDVAVQPLICGAYAVTSATAGSVTSRDFRPPGDPTGTQFADAGLAGLCQVIYDRYGGHDRMAARLSLSRERTWKDPKRRHLAVDAFVARLGRGAGDRYPTKREFKADGQHGLYKGIERYEPGGHRMHAARLRMTMGRRNHLPELEDRDAA